MERKKHFIWLDRYLWAFQKFYLIDSFRLLKVEYVLVKYLFEFGFSCPLSYLVMDGAGNKCKTGVEAMNERVYEIC